MGLLRCANCGESYEERAKFCPNCGVALKPAQGQEYPPSAPAARRPVVSILLSLVAVVGLIAVALSMSFFDDAPGDVGSPVAGLFHAVGAVQLLLGLGVLVSAMFLAMRAFDVKTWGNAIVGLGAASIASLVVIVAEGTFAVVFLAVPGLLAVIAGLLAKRTAAKQP